MIPLTTTGTLIEVTPLDEVQYWPNANSDWTLIDDRTPFQFRVSGELIDERFFFGLYGFVEAGHGRYQNLICNIMLRLDDSDWFSTSECSASFKVGPTIAQRSADYDSTSHCDLPFYHHPDGTFVEGFPRMSRFGGVRVVGENNPEIGR